MALTRFPGVDAPAVVGCLASFLNVSQSALAIGSSTSVTCPGRTERVWLLGVSPQETQARAQGGPEAGSERNAR